MAFIQRRGKKKRCGRRRSKVDGFANVLWQAAKFISASDCFLSQRLEYDTVVQEKNAVVGQEPR